MNAKSNPLRAMLASKAVEYSAELHRFLVRRMRRPQEVEDLAQEVYVRLLKFGTDELIANPRGYILKTASNVAHEFLKKDRRSQEHVVVDSEIIEQFTEHADEDPTYQLARRLSTESQLNAALARLAPIHKIVLLMHYREKYTREEIAARLKVSSRQVKRYLAAAKKEFMDVDWDLD